MYVIDMYDKVMCAVVASALVCRPIQGDSCIHRVRVLFWASNHLNHRVLVITDLVFLMHKTRLK